MASLKFSGYTTVNRSTSSYSILDAIDGISNEEIAVQEILQRHEKLETQEKQSHTVMVTEETSETGRVNCFT